MAIYIVLLLMLTWFTFMENSSFDVLIQRKTKLYTARVYIASVLLIALSALRFEVGTDYHNYRLLYSKANSLQSNQIQRLEPGFRYINLFLREITENEKYLFAITSVIIVGLILIGIRNNSNHFFFSCNLFVCMFFYFQSMNIIRQYFAVAIVFFATKYLIKMNFLKYLLLILLASLFHTTALIMIPFYFILTISYSKRTLIVFVLSALLLRIMYTPVFTIIVKLIPKYSVYLDYKGSSANYYIIFAVITIFMCLKFPALFNKDNTKNVIYFNMAFFSILTNLFSTKNILFARVGIYFTIYLILLIPYVISLVKNKHERFFYKTAIISLAYLYCVLMLINNNSGVVPYKTILN